MPMPTEDREGAVDENLLEKLRQILALTTSPMEGEAQAAAAMLQKFLTKYNLGMADLEKKGAKGSGAGVREEAHDLGKAAFKWKLELAQTIAGHYFCHALVDERAKTVKFVGRPENVEALQLLYKWLQDQIKRIASDARGPWEKEHGEHVDPLRWQVNFGIGAVERLGTRLDEIERDRREREMEARANHQYMDADTPVSDVTALIVVREAEVSDYLEEMYGYRVDGQPTKKEREYRERRAKEEERIANLKATDMEAYYNEFPWQRPEAIAAAKVQMAARQAEWQKEWDKKEKARQRREERNGGPRPRYRYVNEETYRKEEQGIAARVEGRKGAEKLNVEPFLGSGGSGGTPIGA